MQKEPKNTETVGQRIKIIRGNTSQDTFAETLGISRGALSFYERDKNEPSSGTLSKIAIMYGINVSWLLLGNGEMYDILHTDQASKPSLSPIVGENVAPYGKSTHQTNAYIAPVGNISVEHGSDCIGSLPDNAELFYVPLVEARLAAGQGSFETSASIERHYAFRLDFLSRKGKPESMVLMRVTGDSMEPSIKNNDIVLIDQQQTQLSAGKIYAVGVEDMVYLKLVNAEPKRIILSSINKLYKPIELETGEHFEDLVRIIGRAIWVGRELN